MAAPRTPGAATPRRGRRAAPAPAPIAAETATLAGLIASLSQPHADALLIRACDCLAGIVDEIDAARQQGGQEWLVLAAKTGQERMALELAVACTPAMTTAGRLAKARLAIMLTHEAPITRLVLAVMRELVAAEGGRA